MAGTQVQVSLFGDKNLERKFARLERNMQRKVLRPMTDRVAKKTVLPLIKREMPTRKQNPPRNLPYQGHPGPSHTGPPGSLKNNLRVVAIKRSRKVVGRVIMTPLREQLGIPKKYPFYYPVAVESGLKFNRLMGGPQPGKHILRTVYRRHEARIMAAVQKEARIALEREARKAGL
jgi:hypothetical protein